MNQINIQYYKTKFAEFILGSYDGKLCMLDYKYRKMRTTVDKRLQNHFKAKYLEQDDEILQKARKQLDEYFSMDRKEFDIPIITAGSEFQNKVWQALLRIPYGTTISYKGLAKKIGDEKAVRAVANANGANSIGFIIPCHRVIASDGTLGGFAGGIALKQKILTLENNLFT